jgi:hypothetical protein
MASLEKTENQIYELTKSGNPKNSICPKCGRKLHISGLARHIELCDGNLKVPVFSVPEANKKEEIVTKEKDIVAEDPVKEPAKEQPAKATRPTRAKAAKPPEDSEESDYSEDTEEKENTEGINAFILILLLASLVFIFLYKASTGTLTYLFGTTGSKQ